MATTSTNNKSLANPPAKKNALSPRTATNRLPARLPAVRRIPLDKPPSRLGGPLNVDEVLALLPFCPSDDREKMLQLYGQSLAVLAGERKKAAAFLTLLSKSNGFPDSVALQLSPRPTLSLTEAWAKGKGMAAVLADDLLARATDLVTDFATAVTTLVEKRQAGTEKWTCADACDFEFFTYRVTAERRAQVRKSTSRADHAAVHRTETEFERTHKHIRHVHGLIKARRVVVNDPKVSRPDRVQKLIDAMPTWMRAPAYLIVGTQVQERVIEQDVKTEVRTAMEERVVYDPQDPCLAVAGVVLTGWTAEEIEQDRLREQQVAANKQREAANKQREEARMRRAADDAAALASKQKWETAGMVAGWMCGAVLAILLIIAYWPFVVAGVLIAIALSSK